MFIVFVLLFILSVICYRFRLHYGFYTLIRECFLYFKFHVYSVKLLQRMNGASAGERAREHVFVSDLRRNVFFRLAFNMAVSMFDSGSSTDNETLANTNTELYILGVKYTTSTGE